LRFAKLLVTASWAGVPVLNSCLAAMSIGSMLLSLKLGRPAPSQPMFEVDGMGFCAWVVHSDGAFRLIFQEHHQHDCLMCSD